MSRQELRADLHVPLQLLSWQTVNDCLQSFPLAPKQPCYGHMRTGILYSKQQWWLMWPRCRRHCSQT